MSGERFTIRAFVHDLVITEREISLPSHCPQCEADFTRSDSAALRESGWHDQGVAAIVRPDNGIDYDHAVGAGDEALISEYRCRECDHVLAAAEETRLDAPAPDLAPVRVTLHRVDVSEEVHTIPRSCPNCDRSFDDAGALTALQYDPGAQSCGLLGDTIDHWGLLEHDGKCLITAFTCSDCGAVVAECDKDPSNA